MMSPSEVLNINDMVFERLKNPSHPIQQLHLHVHKINVYKYLIKLQWVVFEAEFYRTHDKLNFEGYPIFMHFHSLAL